MIFESKTWRFRCWRRLTCSIVGDLLSEGGLRLFLLHSPIPGLQNLSENPGQSAGSQRRGRVLCRNGSVAG